MPKRRFSKNILDKIYDKLSRMFMADITVPELGHVNGKFVNKATIPATTDDFRHLVLGLKNNVSEIEADPLSFVDDSDEVTRDIANALVAGVDLPYRKEFSIYPDGNVNVQMKGLPKRWLERNSFSGGRFSFTPRKGDYQDYESLQLREGDPSNGELFDFMWERKNPFALNQEKNVPGNMNGKKTTRGDFIETPLIGVSRYTVLFPDEPEKRMGMFHSNTRPDDYDYFARHSGEGYLKKRLNKKLLEDVRKRYGETYRDLLRQRWERNGCQSNPNKKECVDLEDLERKLYYRKQRERANAHRY